MSHEIAKLLLEHSAFLERTKAIQTALDLGMPLHEIEEYLDWVDSIQAANPRATTETDSHGSPTNEPPPNG